MAAVYGPLQPYVPNNTGPHRPALTSHPFPIHKPPEIHMYGYWRSISPTIPQSRQTAGGNFGFAGPSTSGARQQDHNSMYNTNMQASSSHRHRSRSQPPSQMRSRYPYPWGYVPPLNLLPNPIMPSVPDTGEFPPVIPTPLVYRPGPYDHMLPDHPIYEIHRTMPHNGEISMRLNARPPGPASHYPFMNYGRSGRRNGDNGGPGPSISRARYESPPPPYSAVPPSQADSTVSDPLIHPALGWWPDQRRPAMYWDLSSRSRPRYTRREFDAEELASSPFTPPISQLRLVLDPQTRWVFDISARPGERYITLLSLLQDIANLMHTPNKVPHAYWTRASKSKKEAILRAFLKRTHRPLPIPPPHRRPKTRGQIMEEAIVEGAPNGYTNLLVVDLLCENVMFAGLEFHKEPDEWVLRTTRRYS